jgi:pimeloyl-ACP methyl ester carboxylesterase
MGYEYLYNVFDRELAGFDVAAFQQRGLAPTTLEGPFTVDRCVEDAIAELDGHGWDRAWLVGHARGGLLALHLLARAPERVLGGLAIDPMGVVGDGGFQAVSEGIRARLPRQDWIRAEAIDARVVSDVATPEEHAEGWRLIFPSYFASPMHLPLLPDPLRVSPEAYAGVSETSLPALPALEAALPSIRVPFGCVAGAESPLPPSEGSEQIAARIPGAWVEVVEDAGHFPWFERPGCVAAAMARLTAAT